MANNILLSGPAGSSKSAVARQIIEDDPGLVVQADFQSIHSAVSGSVRDPSTGLYPERDGRLNPLTEYVRSVRRNHWRRWQRGHQSHWRPIQMEIRRGERFFLDQLGEGAEERIIDPGREVVTKSSWRTESLVSCRALAIRRSSSWYSKGCNYE